jgi:hypothetical protein
MIAVWLRLVEGYVGKRGKDGNGYKLFRYADDFGADRLAVSVLPALTAPRVESSHA